MYRDFIAMEHYRLHLMERWPEGPVKQASMAAVRAAIESLLATPPAGASGFECGICHERRTKVIEFRTHRWEMPETKAA